MANKRFPYIALVHEIRPWITRAGFVRRQEQQAWFDNAPHTAYIKGGGTWYTVDDITDRKMRAEMIRRGAMSPDWKPLL
jgi:hypothetical protein